jgi:hypothetical protein
VTDTLGATNARCGPNAPAHGGSQITPGGNVNLRSISARAGVAPHTHGRPLSHGWLAARLTNAEADKGSLLIVRASRALSCESVAELRR